MPVIYEIRSILISIVVLTGLMTVGGNAFAANCNKNPTHPQCAPPPPQACDVTERFPALAYPEDGGLMTASGDGCNQVLLVESDTLAGYRLKFDDASGTGRAIWSEYNPIGIGITILQQNFVVNGATNEFVTPLPSPTTLATLDGFAEGFDIEGDVIAFVEQQSQHTRLVTIDLSECANQPCTSADVLSIYDTQAGDCLEDAATENCFVVSTPSPVISNDGKTLYFDVTEVSSGTVGVAKITETSGDWSTPVLLIRDDLYSSASVESISQNDSLLAIRYTAGFLSGGLREDRIILIDPNCSTSCNPSNPTLPSDVMQDFSSWHAAWTVDDTIYVLGNEGKRRKLKHPIEEIDPISGNRTSVGITLGSHPQVESSL